MNVVNTGERIDDLGGGMKILQSSSTPCFAIDAILLTDFIRPASGARIIDLGTGTGIIPLLLSRKMPQARLAGVELVPLMCDLAERSVSLNGLSEMIEIIHGDLRKVARYFSREEADIVVANPPYYKVGCGRMNVAPCFIAARSEKYCTLTDVVLAADYLLKPLGLFYLVYRAERLAELMAALTGCRLNPERLRIVQPYVEREANLVLVEAKKLGRGKMCIMPPLVIYEDRGRYTKEMQTIYGRYTVSGGNTDR